MSKHETFEVAKPTCPHCGYALDDDDMQSGFATEDLYALAPEEGTATVECPSCDMQYAVHGGYRPHYTSAFSEEDL